jgi:hypothetical protein
MSYLIAGIALLAVLLLAGKWFVSANPKTLVKILFPVLVAVLVIVGGLLIATGKLVWVFWMIPFSLPFIMRARKALKNASRMSGGGSGMASEVSSTYLDMRLDHDSGDMDGTVRMGDHAGARLSELSLDQLLDLFAAYSRLDGESARLLGAYLDRMHPEWREQASGGSTDGEDAFEQPAGRMSRAEAFRILGLAEDADEAAYLAAKINEARDVLLKS